MARGQRFVKKIILLRGDIVNDNFQQMYEGDPLERWGNQVINSVSFTNYPIANFQLVWLIASNQLTFKNAPTQKPKLVTFDIKIVN